MNSDQAEYDIRCEWGLRGLRELAPVSDVVVIVDVLSFSTALDIATARGEGFSLSPASLRGIKAGYRLVLPSPNGAALAFEAEHPNVLSACLRNAAAAAALAGRLGSKIAVIAAGETWDTGELRPSLEDLAGAGAVIASLSGRGGRKSPEALLAEAAFERFQPRMAEVLRECSSGRELIERGFAADVELAAEVNVSGNVPRLRDRVFVGS